MTRVQRVRKWKIYLGLSVLVFLICLVIVTPFMWLIDSLVGGIISLVLTFTAMIGIMISTGKISDSQLN